MTIRIYADFNSTTDDGWCWCLRHGDDSVPLDHSAESLGLVDDMQVTLYYSDPGEEFEVNALLRRHDLEAGTQWMGLPDWNTYRRLR